jgi:carboxyl-terminal processing protease
MKFLKHGSILFCSILRLSSIQAQPVITQPNYFETSKNVEIFYSTLRELNSLYVDSIETGKLVTASIDAMLNELDPYTNYFDEEDGEDYKYQTTGKYGGIGCVPTKSGDYIAIEDIFENGPAYKAGVKVGDIVISIDGKSVKNLKDGEISKLIKGEPGTTLQLTIKDAVTAQEKIKKVVREEIVINSIAYANLIGDKRNIAYIRLIQFTERSSINMRTTLDSLRNINNNLEGVILDLRGNPGGLLDEAVNICNLFIPKNQVVVTTKGKVAAMQKEYKTTGNPWDEKIPLTILINKGSASASEIVSGTLQDLDRAVIIGQKSYGKGLVQTTRKLPYNTQIKITTAKYYTPSGRCIQILDYSHRNEDGSVGQVPDSTKNAFKTRIGRTVFDGGGVEPDIKLQIQETNKLVQQLYSKNIIFNFCNKFMNKHATIENPETYKLDTTTVDEFINWAVTQDYEYKTKTDEAFEKLKTISQNENNSEAVIAIIVNLEKSLKHNKLLDLQNNRLDITRVLQQEIVKRYYFSKGKFANSLNEDNEVYRCLKLLNSISEYNQILNLKL